MVTLTTSKIRPVYGLLKINTFACLQHLLIFAIIRLDAVYVIVVLVRSGMIDVVTQNGRIFIQFLR